MIVINLSVTVLISPEWLEHQLSEERTYQSLKRLQEQHDQEQRAAIEALESRTHRAVCKCGWSNAGYATAGRAKMALSAHLQRCRR